MVVCPHCNKHRIVTSKLPQDVVVVMPCPACNELSVFFRGRVIPLNRRIIEEGSFDERKEHFAEVIASFLETGLFGEGGGDSGLRGMAFGSLPEMSEDEDGLDYEGNYNPITQQELDKFARIDLKCIDNAAYFKRHFGD